MERTLSITIRRRSRYAPAMRKTIPARTPRETYLWGMILENWISFYEHERNWVRKLRQTLGEMDTGKRVRP